ncbi:hypothetical protein ACROYT_G007559 [Oculina patagonica]
MEDTGLDFSGCDGGLSFGADLSFQCDLGTSSETAFQGGNEFDLGQLQFPNRLARQLVQSRAPRTNQLGGVVLQAPRAPGPPLQTVNPTPQLLHSSLTAINNPGYQVQTGYQVQPGYHGQPVNIQQPLYNGAAVIYTNQGLPVQSVQPMNHVQQTTTVVNAGLPVQRPGPVIVPPIPPQNWMGLSIFSVIFCTLPFGIIALLFSFMVNDSLRKGEYQRAQKNADIAKWLNVLAILSGLPLCGFIIYLIIKPL